MSQDRKLRVRAAGDTLVPNIEAEEGGARRFIGRTFEPAGPNGEGKWVPTKEGVDVPFRAEYLSALKAGELEADDDKTRELLESVTPKPAAPAKDAAKDEATEDQAKPEPGGARDAFDVGDRAATERGDR